MKKNKISSTSPAGDNSSSHAPGRRDRVEAIKQAIAAGTYRVSDQVLADSLVCHLLREQWERERLKKP